jgi:transposase-like protein
MHADRRAREITGRGPIGKAIVMGLLERHGRAHVKVGETRRKKDVQTEIRKHVEPGSHVYTDALKSYEGLAEYVHEFIDHTEA